MPSPTGSTHGVVKVRVFNDEHEPVSGCVLTIRAVDIGMRSHGQARWLGFEDPDAVLTFRRIPAGKYEVWSQSPSLPTPLLVFECDPSVVPTFDVSVGPRAEILGGTVQFATGKVIAGAMVRDIENTTTALSCFTNREGGFRFRRSGGANQDGGSAFSILDHRGDAGIAEARFPVTLTWGRIDHAVRVAPRGDCAVRLFASHGERVDQFSVLAVARSFHGERIESRTMSHVGVARLAALPTGTAQILVIPASTDWLPVRAEVAIAADGRGELRVQTSAGALFTGHVRSSSGEVPEHALAVVTPSVDASNAEGGRGIVVRSSHRVDGPSEVRAEIGAQDGRFEFACDPNLAYRLVIRAPGHIPFRAEVQSDGGVFRPMSVELREACSVHGRVEPPESVAWLKRYRSQASKRDGSQSHRGAIGLVSDSSNPGERRVALRVKLTADGKFEFRDVEPGVWMLWTYSSVSTSRVGEIELRESTAHESVVVDLSHLRPGIAVGRVLLEGCEAEITVVDVMTAGVRMAVSVLEDGSFEFAAPAGQYSLRVSLALPAGEVVQVTCASPVTIRAGESTRASLLLSLRQLTITVLDAATDAAISGALLSVDEDRATGTYRGLTTDHAGRVVLEPCPVGEFGLSIRDRSSGNWTHLSRVVVADETQDMVLRVSR